MGTNKMNVLLNRLVCHSLQSVPKHPVLSLGQIHCAFKAASVSFEIISGVTHTHGHTADVFQEVRFTSSTMRLIWCKFSKKNSVILPHVDPNPSDCHPSVEN